MRSLTLALVPALLVAGAPVPAPKPAASFPFPIHQKTLANGLKVVVIPTGTPGLVSLQIPVSTGSRNEVEPGKSGFAHFFEHMMFRGTDKTPKTKWNLTLQQTGAAQNAFTSDDLTCYYTLCGKEDLETWLKLEADRFQHLHYPENEFKDESRAVLGEYNKNSSEPMQKLMEVQREAAYTTHTYKHTTMGFIKDIEDMPNQFQYSLEFFKRWYRPDNITVILAGDVEPASAFAMVEKHFGPWKRVAYKAPAVPQEPAHTAPATAHVAWETPTLPWVSIGFHTRTKFSTTDNGAVALAMAGEQLFGRQSELYQRLVVKEQKVDQLSGRGGGSKDPSLFTIAARVRKAEDMPYVREAILDACAKAVALPFSGTRLEEAKNEARLSFARNLDSADGVAGLVARMACFDRDPEAVNKVQALRDGLTVADLARVAKETFRDENRIITTLCKGPLPEAMKAEFPGVAARAAKLAQLPALPLLEQPSLSPLVNLDVAFRAGSVDDPAGKEGLAALTAALLTSGGTASRTFGECTKAAAACGGALNDEVDKELTSFTLTAPRLKAAEALDLALEHLASPGFKDEDFQRLRTQHLNALKVGLKANNDEELGKLALEARLYAEPFAHPVLGTESGIQAITLDDVKAFAKTHYTRTALQAGLAGSFTPEDKGRVVRTLAALPETGAPRPALAAPQDLPATRVRIVAKETRATAISFGFPINVDRKSPDFAALWVATSWLGEHRNSTAHLYQRLRELRGLNYGDYAYIEPFPNGMYASQRSPGILRSQNHFQIWIRPVAPANGAFAVKGALFELDKLVKGGMDEASFQASRTYLVKYLDHLTDTGAKRLGHDLDMQALGLTSGYVKTLRPLLQALTREQVNQALARNFRTNRLDIEVVTKDAEAFKRDLLAEASPVPAYQSPKPELKAEDEAISRFKLDLKPEDVVITPLSEVFN
jgi:zinc protease